MASERLTQAIGRIQGALARLERAPVPIGSPDGPNRAEAEAALKSLDALIADLRKTSHG
jgi:hypothetical protein